MKILSIANSFGNDAHRWLHDLAASAGEDFTCVNLYIGGCSLERHWNNMKNDAQDYEYLFNGVNTGRMASIREALEEGGWDVVTLQQASHFSGQYETYQPYLDELAAYVREMAPGAKLMIQQTWAYEIGSVHPGFVKYGNDQQQMYAALEDAYQKGAAAIGAGIIPAGKLIQTLRGLPAVDYKNGGRSLCRDGFHMHLLYGRYAVACAWVKALSGASLKNCDFIPAEEGQPAADPALLAIIRDTAEALFA